MASRLSLDARCSSSGRSVDAAGIGQPPRIVKRPSAVRRLAAVGVLILFACACASGSSSGAAHNQPASTGSTVPTAEPTTTSGASPGPFEGQWVGHTRLLKITTTGTGSELLDAGCCELVYDITFRLTKVTGDGPRARAKFTVTSARLGPPAFFDHSHPAPRVGDLGTFRLRKGIVTDSLTRSTFCDRAADDSGACGA